MVALTLKEPLVELPILISLLAVGYGWGMRRWQWLSKRRAQKALRELSRPGNELINREKVAEEATQQQNKAGGASMRRRKLQ